MKVASIVENDKRVYCSCPYCWPKGWRCHPEMMQGSLYPQKVTKPGPSCISNHYEDVEWVEKEAGE